MRDEKGRFIKGGKPWNTGKSGCINAGSFQKGHAAINIRRGKDHNRWLADKVGYDALHHWIRKALGKASICENCGVSNAKIYDWANKSHRYSRDINDWFSLCRRCHVKYDRQSQEYKAREYFRIMGRVY